MLDFRLETFLVLCEKLSYTETARFLNITQPNVSQHIRYLEDYYGRKLFSYKSRRLSLTEAGQELFSLAKNLEAESYKISSAMEGLGSRRSLNFGATLTIGEYIMPLILRGLDYDSWHLSMKVENTENLLHKLREGKIDFAIVEGHFNKLDYETRLFSREDFIAIGPRNYRGAFRLEDLTGERLILREEGSGTRRVLEEALFDRNLTLSSFKDLLEIGNMNAIKDLVSQGVGLSFLYRRAALDYIESGLLREIELEDFKVRREFNFVFLKDSYFRDDYLKIYEDFLSRFREEA